LIARLQANVKKSKSSNSPTQIIVGNSYAVVKNG